MSTKLTKYIKKDKSNIFFINDGFLARNKGDKIKEYVSLSLFSNRRQQELVDIINSYYQNLTIIKKPSTRELIIGIKGQEFIRTVWNKYECIFYPVINENIKL
jgi:GMP synthase PP-ATPase subunit